MEQSPLSHSIRNLEAELKIKLFQRTTRRTWLTQAGSRFFPEAKRILADIQATTSSLQVTDEPFRQFRLALGEDLAEEPFTRFLFELEHRRAGALVEVRELTHSEAARLVSDGGADLALTLDGRPVKGLVQRRAWGEPLRLIAPLGHPFAEQDQVELREIGAERLALPRQEICPGYLAQIEDLFRRYQVPVAERVTVRHWNTAVSFAATGRALALCPSSFTHVSTSVAIVPIAAADAELVTWMLYPEAERSPAVSLAVELAERIDREGSFAPPSVGGLTRLSERTIALQECGERVRRQRGGADRLAAERFMVKLSITIEIRLQRGRKG